MTRLEDMQPFALSMQRGSLLHENTVGAATGEGERLVGSPLFAALSFPGQHVASPSAFPACSTGS